MILALYFYLTLLETPPTQPPPSTGWVPYMTAIIVACISGSVQIAVAMIAQKKHDIHEAVSNDTLTAVKNLK